MLHASIDELLRVNAATSFGPIEPGRMHTDSGFDNAFAAAAADVDDEDDDDEEAEERSVSFSDGNVVPTMVMYLKDLVYSVSWYELPGARESILILLISFLPSLVFNASTKTFCLL